MSSAILGPVRLGKLTVSLDFDVRRVWVGVECRQGPGPTWLRQPMHVWVCAVPCLSLHIRFSM